MSLEGNWDYFINSVIVGLFGVTYTCLLLSTQNIVSMLHKTETVLNGYNMITVKRCLYGKPLGFNKQ